MRRFFVRFNRSESFAHTQFSASFATITTGFEFSVHTALTNLPTATPRKSILTDLVHRFPNDILAAVGGPLTCQSNFLPDTIQSGELKRPFLAGALPIEHAAFQPCG